MDAFFVSQPPVTETTAIADVIEIVRMTGAETVIAHVTTATGLILINRAHSDNLRISAEVTPYHLMFDQNRLREVGTIGIGTPPVRSAENRQYLREGVAASEVHLLGSDHAPHILEEKSQEPSEVAPGMPQLETALPALLVAVHAGAFPLTRIIECYAERPARIHGLYPRKGSLRVGADADFVIVDPDREVKIDASKFESAGNYSPFDGWTLTGMPTKIFQRGQKVAEEMRTVNDVGDGELAVPIDEQ